MCSKDLLAALYSEEYGGLVAFVRSMRFDKENDSYGKPDIVEEVYWACKGACDQILQRRLLEQKKVTTWDDISDLVIPIYFLRFLFSVQNAIRAGSKQFSDDAYDQLKTFIAALAQKVLRETTAKEKERVGKLVSIIDALGG